MARGNGAKKRIFTGLDFAGQTPLLEFRILGESIPRWLVWLSYNPDRTQGTYLILNEDGSIWRETTYPDGGVETGVIAPQVRKAGRARH